MFLIGIGIVILFIIGVFRGVMMVFLVSELDLGVEVVIVINWVFMLIMMVSCMYVVVLFGVVIYFVLFNVE